MRRSVKGGSRLHKVGTHLAPAAIPVLAGLRCVLLRQPGSSGSCALFCAAAERCSSGCVVVVEEGIRGRAGRAQTAARCATSGCGPRQWPHRAAAWLPPRPSCRVRPAPVCSQSARSRGAVRRGTRRRVGRLTDFLNRTIYTTPRIPPCRGAHGESGAHMPRTQRRRVRVKYVAKRHIFFSAQPTHRHAIAARGIAGQHVGGRG